LVDKSTRAAGTAAVHTLFRTARYKYYFSVLAAQFHRSIRVGIKFANGNKSSLHFLHKIYAAALRKS
jgi:hypothetical protein